MLQTKIEIVDYEPGHQPSFEDLNRQWIEKYFTMEPLDFEILRDPEGHILRNGGSIFMASWQNRLVGTIALKRHSTKIFELTKMAVKEDLRGKKIGRALAEAAIRRARDSGAEKIILYSNTLLVPAITLYNHLSFREIPVDGPYKRTNIKMELILT